MIFREKTESRTAETGDSCTPEKAEGEVLLPVDNQRREDAAASIIVHQMDRLLWLGSCATELNELSLLIKTQEFEIWNRVGWKCVLSFSFHVLFFDWKSVMCALPFMWKRKCLSKNTFFYTRSLCCKNPYWLREKNDLTKMSKCSIQTELRLFLSWFFHTTQNFANRHTTHSTFHLASDQ